MARKKDRREPAGGDAQARRAERVAAMQRAERRRERNRRIAVVAAVLVVVLGAAGAIAAVIANQPDPPDMAAVQEYEYDGGTHTEEPVAYAESPPVGGDHHPAWLNCGTYDEPVPAENAVHSLEHGAVWLAYDPELPEAQVEELRSLAEGQPYALVSPYPGLQAPVVASAWNHQLVLDGVEDPRLEQFLRTYLQGEQTPEPGAACSGGVGTPVA